MKQKNLETLKNNIIKDLNSCSSKTLDLIYKKLSIVLKKFDNDGVFKECKDFFKRLFKNKKEKCLHFIEDLSDSQDKLTDDEKEKLRKELLEISNIYRTFWENFLALLEAM